MGNERGHYGRNGVSIGAEAPRIIVEHGGPSIGTWLLGAVVVGGAVLYARHQSRQIEQLSKSSGVPYQSFTGSLRQALPTTARSVYRKFTGHDRPSAQPPAPALPAAEPSPAHSMRARSMRR
jgi:hypothetical protein